MYVSVINHEYILFLLNLIIFNILGNIEIFIGLLKE